MQASTKPTTAPAAAPVAAAPAKPAAPAVAGTITLLVTANPKKPGSASAARFALYQQGMAVTAYKAAVKAAGQPVRLAAADLLWDVRHKFITIS